MLKSSRGTWWHQGLKPLAWISLHNWDRRVHQNTLRHRTWSWHELGLPASRTMISPSVLKTWQQAKRWSLEMVRAKTNLLVNWRSWMKKWRSEMQTVEVWVRMAPTAHVFECLVIRGWQDLKTMERCILLAGTGGGMWGFKSPCQAQNPSLLMESGCRAINYFFRTMSACIYAFTFLTIMTKD